MKSLPKHPDATRIHQGPRISLDRIMLPGSDGRPIPKDYVVHPGAVIVLPILDDGRIVMIRNRRFVIDQTLWELPAGTLELGENPDVCAGRELIEETGYESRDIKPLCRFYTTPGFCNELMYAYVAMSLTHVGQQLEADESIEVLLLEAQRVDKMLADHEIVDAKTMLVLLYYRMCRAGQ